LLLSILSWCNGDCYYCCKLSFCLSSSESEIEMGPTYSLGLAYVLGFLKLYILNVSLQSFSFFLITSKSLSNLDIGEDFWEKKKNWKKKRWTSFGNLDCRGKMFANFCYYLNVSYSSFNICNFFLDYFCHFSIRLSSSLILETKNNWNLLIENENKELL
jgi:hypothetical protein